MQFDKSLIKILLSAFEGNDWHYTHSLECCSSFRGKDNRPELRKYLKHLKEKGYVEWINKGHNIHMWRITENGRETLALLQTDFFIR